jgi:hypothetical protein
MNKSQQQQRKGSGIMIKDKTVRRDTLVEFANKIGDSFSWEVKQHILDLIDGFESQGLDDTSHWILNAKKLLSFWDSILITGDCKPSFSIFAEQGNVKLPFVSFSTLPGVTCPGAGECLKFCYSFTAWRYPAAFFRQCQNTLLMAFKRDAIEYAYNKIADNHRRKMSSGKTTDKLQFRLYVDGDFKNIDDLSFWTRLLKLQTSTVDCYGYSKSWKLFEEYEDSGFYSWPVNYRLNLSSGSKYENDSRLFIKLSKLPICRGEFVALEIDKSGLAKGFKVFDQKEYHSRVRAELRAKYPGKKIVSCGGVCGSCNDGTGKHWCASDRLRNVIIGIGVHGKVRKKGAK